MMQAHHGPYERFIGGCLQFRAEGDSIEIGPSVVKRCVAVTVRTDDWTAEEVVSELMIAQARDPWALGVHAVGVCYGRIMLQRSLARSHA